MKKILYSALLLTGISLIAASCSNGDYVASPTNPANNSINPMKPLSASDFNWMNGDSLRADISDNSGTYAWVADSTVYGFDAPSGAFYIRGIKGKQALYLTLKNTWGGQVYNMGFKQYNILAQWFSTDSIYKVASWYQSALGNSGEIYMTEVDSVYIRGMFYFQGINGRGEVMNAGHGVFNKYKNW